MTWFKVDDKFHSHPKVCGLSLAACGLWTKAGSWCSDHLTDGLVPRGAVLALGGNPELAAELVDAGLWEVVERGWQFHDWGDHQPSGDAVRAKKAEAKERMRKVRSQHVRANNERTRNEQDVNVERTSRMFAESSPNPDPDPVPKKNSLTRARVREEQESDQMVGSDFMFNATGRHWMGFERSLALIGGKPEAERRKALETMQADPWVQANKVHCNPDHILRKWPVYSTGAGAPQLVAVQGSTSEQQAAKRRMDEIRSQARTLKAELAKLGDDVDGQARRFTIEQELVQLQGLYDRAKRSAG